MTYYKCDIKFVNNHNKPKLLPIYFSQNTQDVQFQAKSYYISNKKLLSSEHKRIFLNGKDLNEIELRHYSVNSSWQRSIFSYKSQQPTLAQLENTDIFEFFKKETQANLVKSRVFQKLLQNTLEKMEESVFSLYYKGLMYEYGLYVGVDYDKAWEFYQEGAFVHKRQDCTERVMMYHLRPSNLNGGIVSNDFGKILDLICDVFANDGIFDQYSKLQKSFNLLASFYIQLDMSLAFKIFALNRVKSYLKKMKKNKFDLETLADVISKDKESINNLILYLVLETSFYSPNMGSSLRLLELVARDESKRHLNTLVGDLYDETLVGTKHPWYFEKRLKFYMLSDNKKRMASMYELIYFYIPIYEETTREKILKNIITLYQDPKYSFDLSKIYFLLNYYFEAGEVDIKKFLGANILKAIYAISSQETIEVENEDDESAEGNSPRLKSNLQYIQNKKETIEEFQMHLETQINNTKKNERTYNCMNYIKQILNSKFLNFKYATSLIHFVYLFGKVDHIDLLFDQLKHTHDDQMLKIAEKVKLEDQGSKGRTLPLIRAYEKDAQFTTDNIKKMYSSYLELLNEFFNEVSQNVLQRKINNRKSFNYYNDTEFIETSKGITDFRKSTILYRGYKILLSQGHSHATKLFLDSACALFFKNIIKKIEGGYATFKTYKLIKLLHLSKQLNQLKLNKIAKKIEIYLMLSCPSTLAEKYIVYKALLYLTSSQDALSELDNISAIILRENLSTVFLAEKDNTVHNKNLNKHDIYKYLTESFGKEKMENFVSQSSTFSLFEQRYHKQRSGENIDLSYYEKNESEFVPRIEGSLIEYGINNVYDENFPKNDIDSRHYIIEMDTLRKSYYEKYMEEELKELFLNEEFKERYGTLYKNIHQETFLHKLINEFDASMPVGPDNIAKKLQQNDGPAPMYSVDFSDKYFYESQKYSPNHYNTHFSVNEIIYFENSVRKFRQIKLYSPDEIEMIQTIKVNLPEFEKSGVTTWEGVIKKSQQYCTVIAVEIYDYTHLHFIEQNLHMMLTFNPQFVNYYGLIVEKNYKEINLDAAGNRTPQNATSPRVDIRKQIQKELEAEEITGIVLYFICEDISTNFHDFLTEIDSTNTCLDINEKLYLAYYIVYAVTSCHNLGIPLLSINPFSIFISTNFMVKLLIPWFLKDFGNQKNYYNTFLNSNESVSLYGFFLPPEIVYNPTAQAKKKTENPYYYENVSYPDLCKKLNTSKNGLAIEGMYTFDKDSWLKMKNFDTFCVGAIIVYLQTGKTIGEIPKKKVDLEEFYSKLYSKSTYESSIKDLYKKVGKLNIDKNLIDSLKKLIVFKPENRGNLFSLEMQLQKVNSTSKIASHQLFTREMYIKLIIMNTKIRLKKGDIKLRDPGKQSYHLPTNQIYEGYITEKDIGFCNFFFSKSLVFSIDLTIQERGFYESNKYISNTETLQLQMVKDKPKFCRFLIKGNNFEDEKRESVEEFSYDSFQPEKNDIYVVYERFLTFEDEDICDKEVKSFGKFEHHFGSGSRAQILQKHMKNVETNNFYMTIQKNILETLIEDNKKSSHKFNCSFIDPFGYEVQCHRNANDPGEIDWEEGFKIEPINPQNFSSSTLVVPKQVKYHCFTSDILSYRIEQLAKPFISYSRFLNEINKERIRLTHLTYYESRQYWGYMKNNEPIDTYLYTNADESTCYNMDSTNCGLFSNTRIKFVYTGLFVNNQVHNFGKFEYDNKLLYEGEVKFGVPYGKGVMYSNDTGKLLFIGMVIEGIPKYGVTFLLPAVYEGFFYFNNIVIDRQSMLQKSQTIFNLNDKGRKNAQLFQTIFQQFFNFDNRFKFFEIDGKVINFNKYILELEGKLNSNNKNLNGMMRIIDKNRSIYHGQLKNSERNGFGLLINKNATMLGYWNESVFQGKICFQNQSQNDKNNSSKQNINTINRITSRPKKLEGKFKITENIGINFISSGIMTFEDGSVYSGEIKNNTFHGIGKQVLTDGTSFEGNFSQNIPNRIGKLTTREYIYEGEFNKGVKNGFGIITFHSAEDFNRMVKKKKVSNQIANSNISDNSIPNQYLKCQFIDDKIIDMIIDNPLFIPGTNKIVLNPKKNIKSQFALNKTKQIKFEYCLQKNVSDFEPDEPNMEIEVKGLVEIGLSQTNIDMLSQNKYNVSGMKSAAYSTLAKEPEKLNDSIELVGEDDKKSNKSKQSKDKAIEENKLAKSNLKKYCFMGEILPETNQFLGFISGNTKIPFFQGILDSDFKNSIGVMYDSKKSTEFSGYFENFFKLNGYGTQIFPTKKYKGKFENAMKNGVCIKIKKGVTVHDMFIEFKNDSRNGLSIEKFEKPSDIKKMKVYRIGHLERVVELGQNIDFNQDVNNFWCN